MIKDTKLQLRNHDPKPTPGVPDVVAAERVHEHTELPAITDDHAGHEEFAVLPLEKEEGAVSVLVKQVTVITTERHDLAFGPAETLEVLPEAAEDLRVRAVLDHLVDVDSRFLRRLAETTLLCVVDADGEDVRGSRDGLLAVRGIELDCTIGVETLEPTDDVVGEFGESDLHGSLDHRADLVALGEDPTLEVAGVEHSVSGKLFDRFRARLTSGRHDHVDSLFLLSGCNHVGRHVIIPFC